MMKQIFLFFLLFCLCMGGKMDVIQAEESLQWMASCTPEAAEGMEVQETAETAEIDHRKVWDLGSSSLVSFVITDSRISAVEQYSNCLLQICYYDAGFNSFEVTYRNMKGENVPCMRVFLEDENSWKTEEAVVSDMNWAMPGIQVKALSHTIPEAAAYAGVYIGSVCAEKLSTNGAVQLSVSSDCAGNIFFDGLQPNMKVVFNNRLSSMARLNVLYHIYNYEETQELENWTEDYVIAGGAAETSFVTLPKAIGYGAFVLKITAVDPSHGLESQVCTKFSFAKSRGDGILNEKMGVDGHFAWLSAGTTSQAYCRLGIDIAQKAGFSTERDGLGWNWLYNPQSGKTNVYIPGQIKTLQQNLETAGMGFQCSISGDKYGSNDIPVTEEERNEFAEMVYDLVAMSHNAAYSDYPIQNIRIWNEPNAAATNTNNAAPKDYMLLIKAVHDTLASDYPEVKIGAFSTTGLENSYKWIKEALDSIDNPMQYFDYISIHHYNLPTVNYINSCKKIREMIESYQGGDEKEIWYNEYGIPDYRVRISGSTAAVTRYDANTKAAYLVELTAQMLGNHVGDKLFPYVLSDKGFDKNYWENTFGLVDYYREDIPYAAKPALVAMSAFNAFTAGYRSSEGITESGSVERYIFYHTADETDVSILWAKGGSADISVPKQGGNVYFYDLYGNALTNVTELDDCYQLTVTDQPVYIVYDMYTGERYTAAVTRDGAGYTFAGKFESGDAVTLMVYPRAAAEPVPTDTMLYCDQLRVESTGKFLTQFKLPDTYSTYRAFVGNRSLSEILVVDFNDMGRTENVITIKKSESEINNLEELQPGDQLEITAEFVDEELMENCSLLFATYSDGMLKSFKHLENIEYAENKVVGILKLDDISGMDEMHIFLWKSVNDLCPLAKCRILS